MVERPSGTVTFLFTDIEGSTQLWERGPTAMQRAVALHDQLLREVIGSHGGYVFTTAGDSFAASFHRVDTAIRAAVEAQRRLATLPWPEGVELFVRMGIHTGEADERDGDYFGPAVNLAARVMSRAHGGQIVASGVSAALLGGQWDVRSLGRHRMKGITSPVELVQMIADGMRSEFSPIVGSEISGNLLPAGATDELIGRARELSELTSSLENHRLVTLTGVGGVGKTRLALALAASLTPVFDDGCWLVDLAPVADPNDVPNALLAALSLRPYPGQTPAATLVEALRDRSSLLVLDNCEHLLTPVALLVRELIQSTQSIRIVATSREPLAVPGERIFPVPSLDAETEGAELFLTRCHDADPSFRADRSDAEAIVQLCRRLDGIPLAIELAAARVRTLGPRELLDRLEDRFRLLRGTQRGVVDRHQTLLAAMEWSYQLLDDDEKDLFCRLSVLPTSFDLRAAEAVCSGGMDEFDVVDLLDSFVSKSLITSFRDEGTTRFRMLETLRQFGGSQMGLEATIEVRDRHLTHYLGVAERARDLFEEGPGFVGGELFETEWENILAATAWAASDSDLGQLERLLPVVHPYCWLSSRFNELTSTLAEVVERPECSPLVLAIAAIAYGSAGELSRATELAAEALQRGQGSDGYWALSAATLASWYSGEVDEGWDYAQRAVEAARARRPFTLLMTLGSRAVMAGTVAPDTSHEYVAEIIALETRIGSIAASAYASWCCARALRLPGDSERMLAHVHRARTLADHPSLRYVHTWALLSESVAALFERADASATTAIVTATQRFREQGNWLPVWVTIEGVALHLARNGRPAESAVILGHLDHHNRRHAVFTDERRELSPRLRLEHPTETARGAAMGRDELIDWAIDVLGKAARS